MKQFPSPSLSTLSIGVSLAVIAIVGTLGITGVNAWVFHQAAASTVLLNLVLLSLLGGFIVELFRINDRLQKELNERQRTEAALHVSQARFAGILDIADDAIISLNQQQQIVLFNQGAERIFGYTAAEVLGQPLDILMPQRFVAMHRQHVEAFQQTTQTARCMAERQEIYGQRKNGTEFPAEASISQLNLPEETLLTVILRDISDRKQMEHLKDEFISVVSHELRTPLTSIHASLGILASGLLTTESQQGKQLLKIAADSTVRLVRLVNDILDIEQIEAGQVPLKKKVCQVTKLQEQVVTLIQPLAHQAQVTLLVTDAPYCCWADPDRIVQTLTNLLSNAIKFSPAGSQVSLSVIPQSEQLLFQIQDQGRGIPAHQLNTIFERFQQVDASDSRDQSGTGLGLAICRSIVEQHQGKIWAESTLGQGSTFYFTLPIGSLLPLPFATVPLSAIPPGNSVEKGV